jgi:hypothetical protein
MEAESVAGGVLAQPITNMAQSIHQQGAADSAEKMGFMGSRQGQSKYVS